MNLKGTIEIFKKPGSVLYWMDFKNTSEAVHVRAVTGGNIAPTNYRNNIPIETVCQEVSKFHKDYLVIGKRG